MAESESKEILQTPALCTLVVGAERASYDISRVELVQSVDEHHLLRARLRQVGTATATKDFSDPGTYTSFLGKPVSLTIKPRGGIVDEGRELGFIGVITQVDLENSIDGLNEVTIIAHSPTIAMDGAPRNAFYYDMTYADIVGSLVRNYSISPGAMDSSSPVYKYIVQRNETDFAFIRRLADGCGMFAHYDGKEFRLLKPAAKDTEELAWRLTLGAFSLGLGTSSNEFEASIYFYEQTKTFSADSGGIAPRSSLSGLSRTSADASKDMYKDMGYSPTAKRAADAKTLNDILSYDKWRSMGKMITGHGHSIVPKIAAGHSVRVKGMDKFDGVYFVQSVRHTYDESGKYHNTFTCTPIELAFPSGSSKQPNLTTLQMGVVTENNDEGSLGRVKVKFPWLDSSESVWVRVLTPYAGKDRGWYVIPEIGDEVLVGYEYDHPDLPIVLGSMYNSQNAPHGDMLSSKNDTKMFLTRGGNKIMLSDKDGSEQIMIATKDGKNQIVLDAAAPSITIESKGDIKIKGKSISLDSDTDVNVKAGANAKIEATANMTVKGGGQNQIEGMTVTVKGTPIQLN